ncbi:MAG: prolyl oligopeptidase family serine peptidase [Desulfobacterales bacterium]|nr:prolyl oligopeptidase family serine peptidase [Desulfobacterales bacterium]
MKPFQNASPRTGQSSGAGFLFLAGALLMAAAGSFWLSGCTPMLSKKAEPAGGMTYKARVDMRINGFRRTYRVHVPPGYRAEHPLPLVVVIHGAFDTAKNMEIVSGFSELADRENFIVVYPNGMGIFGLIQHWNAGHCCGKAAADGVDDVAFLETVIKDVSSRLSVDPERIYMTGFSNGGMLTHRFAAEKGHLLAAAAPLAASAGGAPDANTPEWSPPVPQTLIPLLVMHGTEDRHVPFAGGASENRKTERRYWPVAKTTAFWVKHNRAVQKPSINYLHDQRVKVTTWKGSPKGADVVLYAIDGWGHQWPGRHFTALLDPEDPLRNFDAAEIIWHFFKTRQR